MTGSGETSWGTRACALEATAERSVCGGRGARRRELQLPRAASRREQTAQGSGGGNHFPGSRGESANSVATQSVTKWCWKVWKKNLFSEKKGLGQISYKTTSFQFYLTKSFEVSQVPVYGCVFKQLDIAVFIFKNSARFKLGGLGRRCRHICLDSGLIMLQG